MSFAKVIGCILDQSFLRPFEEKLKHFRAKILQYFQKLVFVFELDVKKSESFASLRTLDLVILNPFVQPTGISDVQKNFLQKLLFLK